MHCTGPLERNDIDAATADALQAWLEADVEWHTERLNLFGRSVEVPRRVAWFGDDGLNYRYSGTDHPACGWPAPLDQLRETLAQATGIAWNFVLLNRYDDGGHYMGWHRDDEATMAGPVCSVSLGASRRFLLEDAAGERHRLELAHGDVLVHPGQWRHCLPQTRTPVGRRINLSFRRLRANGARG